MKILLTAAAILLSAAALGQIHYKSRDGKLELKADRGSISFPVKTFTLSGNVFVRSDDQGIRLNATGTVKGEITAGKVQSLDAGGNVTAVKAAGTRKTELKGRDAKYRVAAGEGRLTLEGPVTITDIDSATKSSFSATGGAGSAALDPDDKGTPLRRATLSGNVRINLVQAPKQGQPRGTSFKATGDRMVLDNVNKPATITMTGDIKMEGTGDDPLEGEITGVKKAILVLNEKGELARIDLSSESAAPTTTTIRGLGKKGSGG